MCLHRTMPVALAHQYKRAHVQEVSQYHDFGDVSIEGERSGDPVELCCGTKWF